MFRFRTILFTFISKDSLVIYFWWTEEKMKAKKRELFPPDDITINNKIKNLFKGVNKIPFEDFVDFLQVDRKYVLESIHIWTERYNIKIIENLVIKNSD